jgi:hypothetical protein
MATNTALPVRVGLLYDYPQAGDLFAKSLQLGLDEVAATGRLDRDVELVERQSRGQATLLEIDDVPDLTAEELAGEPGKLHDLRIQR